MRTKEIYQSVLAVCSSLLTYLFGGWSALLGVLVTFVVLDYVTGVLAAAIEGKLNSNIGLKGIAKKISIFVLVAVGHLADIAIGTDIIMNAVIYFYIANELLSILENIGETGLPIPDVLKNAVESLKGKSNTK